MAISTIKHDKKGNPQRDKYCICVLRHLEQHQWNKSDTFAPVMSQQDLRLLVAEAVQQGQIPKTCDVKQAFVKLVLPDNEKYVLSPSPHCPLTPPNTYLLLKQTLHGL